MAIASGTSNQSDVWNYFTKSVTDDLTYGSCYYCKTTLKCLYASTSSLHNHLKTAHITVHTKLAEKEATKRKAQIELKEPISSIANYCKSIIVGGVPDAGPDFKTEPKFKNPFCPFLILPACLLHYSLYDKARFSAPIDSLR